MFLKYDELKLDFSFGSAVRTHRIVYMVYDDRFMPILGIYFLMEFEATCLMVFQ